MTGTDRLFTRPTTLTDDERQRARDAIDQTPAALEALYAAALGNGEAAAESMRRVIEGVRCTP